MLVRMSRQSTRGAPSTKRRCWRTLSTQTTADTCSSQTPAATMARPAHPAPSGTAGGRASPSGAIWRTSRRTLRIRPCSLSEFRRHMRTLSLSGSRLHPHVQISCHPNHSRPPVLAIPDRPRFETHGTHRETRMPNHHDPALPTTDTTPSRSHHRSRRMTCSTTQILKPRTIHTCVQLRGSRQGTAS